MADLERMLSAYERGLARLHDELATGLDASREEQHHLDLLHELLKAVLNSYTSFQLSRMAVLDTSTSVMYLTSDEGGPRVIDVSLRTLVDHATLTSWAARFLNGSLAQKRTMLVAGPKGVGKSSLLNALVQLIPVDERVVAIEQVEALPALKSRSFTVRLTAPEGSPARATSLKKAAGMKPSWLLVDDLAPKDALPFLEALTTGPAGLATMDSPDPEVTLTDWTAGQGELIERLGELAPLIIFMNRDKAGRPRVLQLLEVSLEGRRLRLHARRPGDETEPGV